MGFFVLHGAKFSSMLGIWQGCTYCLETGDGCAGCQGHASANALAICDITEVIKHALILFYEYFVLLCSKL